MFRELCTLPRVSLSMRTALFLCNKAESHLYLSAYTSLRYDAGYPEHRYTSTHMQRVPTAIVLNNQHKMAAGMQVQFAVPGDWPAPRKLNPSFRVVLHRPFITSGSKGGQRED
jgi:hypothetical protein